MKKVIIFFILILTQKSVCFSQEQSLTGFKGKVISCIASSKTAFDKIFIGVENEGLFLTSDFGKSWSKIIVCNHVSSVIFNQKDLRFAYTTCDNKVFISSDSGFTFTSLAEILERKINNIAIDETQSKAIILGTDKGVLKSFDNGHTFYSSGLNEQAVQSMILIPNAPKPIIYVATETGGIYKSFNYGLSWTSQNNGLSDYTTIFLNKSPNESNVLITALSTSGFYISNDLAQSWNKLNVDLNTSEGAFLDYFDGEEKKIVLSNYLGKVFMLDNKTQTFTKVFDGFNNLIVTSFKALSYDKKYILFGTTDGLYLREIL
jgi:photosystem II stability/assembly factor-like uncharacterized protein